MRASTPALTHFFQGFCAASLVFAPESGASGVGGVLSIGLPLSRIVGDLPVSGLTLVGLGLGASSTFGFGVTGRVGIASNALPAPLPVNFAPAVPPRSSSSSPVASNLP